MLRKQIAAGCLAVLVTAACHTQATQPPDTDGKQDPKTARRSNPQPRAIPEPEFPGVAHSGTIDALTVCPDGSCAMTRDNVGGLRLWPALDGSAEPQPIPVRGASAFTAAKAGKHFTAFVVEASGGARIFSVAPDGTADETAALPPFSPVLEGHVLAGGERVLAVLKDGTIRLFDTKGKELAKFDERKFQPAKLRVDADGTEFVASMNPVQSGAAFTLEVQRFKIGGNAAAPKIERHGPPRIINTSTLVDSASSVMSTDARRFAVAARGAGDKWELDVYDLAKDSKPTTHLVRVPAHIVPHLGFITPTKMIVSSNEGTVSWLLDLESGDTWPRTAIPQDFSHQGKVQASANGRQVVAYGNWLFVQDVQARRHRFLGYKAAQGAGIAVSPKNGYVAWAYMGGPVYVEGIGKHADEGSLRLQLDAEFGVNKVRFLDEEHLVIVDGAGGVFLYHWPTQTLIDRAGVMGNVRTVDIDTAQGLLLIDRHNNDASVFEVSARGFQGPYIVADQSYRLGLLQPTPPSAAVLWTLDGTNKLRTYTLDELRGDLSRAKVETMGEALQNGQPAPLAIDRKGRHYGIRWNGSQLELFVALEKDTTSKAVPSGDINQIVPAPNGKRFLVVFNRAGMISVAVHDTKALKPLWSYSTGVFNNDVSWSEDGDLIGLAANTGAILLDAKTGKPVQRRCGLEFASVSSPPSNAFTNFGQRSLCEI